MVHTVGYGLFAHFFDEGHLAVPNGRKSNRAVSHFLFSFQMSIFKTKTFLVVLLAFATQRAAAYVYDCEVDGIYYKLNGTSATVTFGKKYSGNIVIPENITYNGNTYSVTTIGEAAFWSCADLTSVTIPNSVTSIDYSAFRG